VTAHQRSERSRNKRIARFPRSRAPFEKEITEFRDSRSQAAAEEQNHMKYPPLCDDIMTVVSGISETADLRSRARTSPWTRAGPWGRTSGQMPGNNMF